MTRFEPKSRPERTASSLMLVTADDSAWPLGGRAQLSRLHRSALEALLQERLIVHTLPRARSSAPIMLIRALGGAIDGVEPREEALLVRRIGESGVTHLFLNGSNLGRLARAVKRAMPQVTVLTFFHNVEAEFFRGALRARPSVRAAGVWLANRTAERMAVRWSDRLVVLSQRDSDVLKRLYGRAGTDILPIGIADKLPPRSEAPDIDVEPGEYLLFVGGAFYANLQGIAWFAREVAPRIRQRTLVVGHGMEEIRAPLEASGNVEVIGKADRLDGYYRGARAVIAPIFGGSGMKTKVAEALMFGKRVIGTPEAFSGYEEVGEVAGDICDTADGFIAAVAALRGAKTTFDPSLRALYERHYSPAAAERRLGEILVKSGLRLR